MYRTIYETTLRSSNGTILTSGSTTNNDGNTFSCSTFIVLCTPHVFVHLCYLDNNNNNNDDDDDIMQIRIKSDVREWNQHPNPRDDHSQSISFTLKDAPFLCTQSEGGQLTHFFQVICMPFTLPVLLEHI